VPAAQLYHAVVSVLALKIGRAQTIEMSIFVLWAPAIREVQTEIFAGATRDFQMISIE